MAEFLDGNSSHIYLASDTISFRIGPFPCQAGKTDNLVFGIMDRDKNFMSTPMPVSDLEAAPNGEGYYRQVTAANDGYFEVTSTISNENLSTGVLAVKIYDSNWKLLRNESTGAEAIIPLVDADGNMAMVAGSITGKVPSDMNYESSLVKSTDDDFDKVYFDGQKIQIKFTATSQMLPMLSQIPENQVSFTFGVFTDQTSFITKNPPLTNVQVKKLSDGFEITGDINNPNNSTLPAGVLGAGLNLPAPFSQMPGLSSPMPVYSDQKKPAIVGVTIPEGMLVTSAPLLSDLKNLYNTERPITFTKGGEGSVTFAPGLNIIDNRDELAELNDNIMVGYNHETQVFAFEVKTKSLTFLGQQSAGIKCYGVMQKLNTQGLTTDNLKQFINIVAIDNTGKAVPSEKIGEYIDQTALSYDEKTDILTIPVNHFSRYEISKKVAPVEVLYKKITVTPSKLTMKVNQIKKLKVTATPKSGKSVEVSQKAEYTSSNTGVAEVVKGMVTAVGKGNAEITVQYGGLEKKISVKVK